MMSIGEVLYANVGTTTVYSPWFEKCGNQATFAVEVIAQTPGGVTAGSLEVRVQTKEMDETDQQAVTLERQDVAGFWFPVVGGTTRIADSYMSTARYKDFKDLVRFMYIVQNTAPAKSFWVQSRVAPPMWQSNSLCCPVEAELAKDSETTF